MTVPDDVFLAELAALIAARTGQACYPERVPPTVTPEVPYQVLEFAGGGTWDRGAFERAHTAGSYRVQLRSVGKGTDTGGISDVSWMAQKGRAALDAGALTGTGWRAEDAASEDPPVPVEGAGTLRNVVEVFSVYVQAV